MAIAMALAGYAGAEADEMRRTMGNMRKEARFARGAGRLRERLVANDITPRIRPRWRSASATT